MHIQVKNTNVSNLLAISNMNIVQNLLLLVDLKSSISETSLPKMATYFYFGPTLQCIHRVPHLGYYNLVDWLYIYFYLSYQITLKKS